MNKKVIIVLGMHRSGTSAVTRGLKALGVELGDNLMPPVANNNETGFWEDLDLNSLNEEILALVGSSWNSPRLIEPDELTVQPFSSLRLRAIDLINKKIGKSDRFGMKNPRMCKTLPFWQQVINHCDDVEDEYVIAVRNPLSVAHSLAARDGFSAEKSYLLWLGHMIPAMEQTEGKRRVVIDYDLLMDNPLEQMERLAQALEIECSNAIRKDIGSYTVEFLAQGLRHAAFNINHLTLDSRLPTLAADAYRHLLKLAQDVVSPDDPASLDTWHRISEIYSSMTPVYDLLDREERMLLDRERQIEGLHLAVVERERQIEGLHRAAVERDGQITSLNQEVADRDGQIAAINKAIADRDTRIGKLESLLNDKNNHIRNLETAIDIKERLIEEQDGQVQAIESALNMIKNSRVWRAAEALRSLVYIKILGPFPLLQRSALTISRAGFPAFYQKAKVHTPRLSSMTRYFQFIFSVFKEPRKSRIQYLLKTEGFLGLVKLVWNKVNSKKNQFKNSKEGNAGVETPIADLKRWQEQNDKSHLHLFLLSNSVLEFPAHPNPRVSIILLFYNRAEVSLKCLESLAIGAGDVPFEVVILDNNSTDETSALLDRIHNAKIIRNKSNIGFGGGCNQAVESAIGEYILFLNNDTQLMPNAIKTLVCTIEEDKSIGAVGGKLIDPSGRLQEAGSIIWNDGSCAGYGREKNPFLPEYSYVKDVDYCSGALMLTPRALFNSIDGFDALYAPAYYEDVDYCLQLWEKGYRVVFQPFAVAKHYEYGSWGKSDAIVLQQKNHQKFREKWGKTLEQFHPPGNVLEAREHKKATKRILFIDDQIPDYRLGSGYPRTYRILITLADLGYRLTFLPLQIPTFNIEIAHELQSKGIEVFFDENDKKMNFTNFLSSRPNYYDAAFVSRPHNMRKIIEIIQKIVPNLPVIYDAEAIFALRDIKFSELNGKIISEAEKVRLIMDEISLTKDATIITAVSQVEKDVFLKYGTASVKILGHVINADPTPAIFEERKDILFVGGILGSPSPNEDAVRYFAKEIFPLVREKIDCHFYVVGSNKVKAVWELMSDNIHITGKVEDLSSYYNRCRLFVVPTRYSAGIPLKLLEAAAHGLPAVVTPLTAMQLGWQENQEVLVGKNAEDFAKKVIELYSDKGIFLSLREKALEYIRKECGERQFKEKLLEIMSSAYIPNA